MRSFIGVEYGAAKSPSQCRGPSAKNGRIFRERYQALPKRFKEQDLKKTEGIGPWM
jgi:hypothetical protein